MVLKQQSAIVVGAGIAGLTAAYRLQEAGLRVVVLEAASVVGGRMGDRRQSDLVFNSGARLVYPFGATFHRLVRQLGLSEALLPLKKLSAECVGPSDRHTVELMPSWRALGTPGLGLGERLRLAASVFEMRRLRGRVDPDWAISALEYDDMTLADYARTHLGPNTLTRMIEPVFRATRSFNPEAISALFYVTTLPHLLGQDTVFTLAGGMGRVCQALAAQLTVRTDAVATRIRRLGNGDGISGVEVQLRDGATLHADHAVCAVEGARAGALIEAPSAAEKKMFDAVRYNSLGIVHYGMRGPLPARMEFAMRSMSTRIATYQQLPENPAAGRPLAQIYCQLTPEAAQEAQLRGCTETLDTLLRNELRARFTDFDARCVAQVNQWIPYKLPVFYPGYGRQVAAFQQWQASEGARIAYCGDWLSQALLTGACASGERAAQQLLACAQGKN